MWWKGAIWRFQFTGTWTSCTNLGLALPIGGSSCLPPGNVRGSAPPTAVVAATGGMGGSTSLPPGNGAVRSNRLSRCLNGQPLMLSPASPGRAIPIAPPRSTNAVVIEAIGEGSANMQPMGSPMPVQVEVEVVVSAKPAAPASAQLEPHTPLQLVQAAMEATDAPTPTLPLLATPCALESPGLAAASPARAARSSGWDWNTQMEREAVAKAATCQVIEGAQWIGAGSTATSVAAGFTVLGSKRSTSKSSLCVPQQGAGLVTCAEDLHEKQVVDLKTRKPSHPNLPAVSDPAGLGPAVMSEGPVVDAKVPNGGRGAMMRQPPTQFAPSRVHQELTVGPFCQEACGANLVLTDGGYTATRSRGCRESLAISRGPLEQHPAGFYFEVEIKRAADGWIGGLGIGVTHTAPQQFQRLPEKAWKVPSTFIVGYSGVAYLNGTEHPVHWRPDTLKVGQRVGLLVTEGANADLQVLVDREVVACVGHARLREARFSKDGLYPIVDVFNATLSVTLAARSTPLSLARRSAAPVSIV